MSSYQVPSYVLHYDDEAEIRDKYWNPKPYDKVLDIGARYGSYTLPALAMGASVQAVDYNGQMLQLLKQAAQANGFAAELETMQVFLYDGTPYPAELSGQIAEPCPPDGAVWSTIDDICPERVDWVKVDVEGAELAVLKGGLRTLADHHPMLLIEDHTRVYGWVRKNHIAMQMHGLLTDLGYEVESVPYQAKTGSPRDFTIAT